MAALEHNQKDLRNMSNKQNKQVFSWATSYSKIVCKFFKTIVEMLIIVFSFLTLFAY